MIPGNGGMYGPGIYFADSKDIAMKKQQRDGVLRGIAIVLTLRVDFGDALVVEGSYGHMTPEILKARGCQSVKGRRTPISGWEFVLYDSSRILEFVNFECQNPDAAKYSKELDVLAGALRPNQGPRRVCTKEADVTIPDQANVTVEEHEGFTRVCIKPKADGSIQWPIVCLRNGIVQVKIG
jgi:hypothetical protein